MSHLPGKFVWFEHHSPDPDKARAFYERLFGWHVEAVNIGDLRYRRIMKGQDGIGGIVPIAAGQPASWMSYLSVADVNESFAAARAAGAEVVEAPFDVAPIGRAATLRDPTGATFSLWHSAQSDRPDVNPAPAGDWCWNELWTPDTQKALAFYERVFGYTHDVFDMGEGRAYYLLKDGDGRMRAGVWQTTDAAMPVGWLPYVEVADCDASVNTGRQLGAQNPMPPTDITGVGRIAVLVDPLGAMIAVIKSVPMAV